MIKENQKLFNRLNVATDAAAAFISIAAAYLLVFSLLDFDRNYPLVDYFKLLLIFVPLQLVTYGCMGLYSSFRGKSFANETGKLTAALFLDGMAMIALLYVIQIINFSRWALAIFLALEFCARPSGSSARADTTASTCLSSGAATPPGTT